jgi:hypothetical protein
MASSKAPRRQPLEVSTHYQPLIDSQQCQPMVESTQCQPMEDANYRKHGKSTDCFQPRRSRLARRAFDTVLRSDDDIWVERYYLNTRRQKINFYRSYNTGKCVLSEPPSGARHIVRIQDLERAAPDIQAFAKEQLDRGMYTSKMELSQPTLYPISPKKLSISRLFK